MKDDNSATFVYLRLYHHIMSCEAVTMLSSLPAFHALPFPFFPPLAPPLFFGLMSSSLSVLNPPSSSPSSSSFPSAAFFPFPFPLALPLAVLALAAAFFFGALTYLSFFKSSS